MSQNQFLLDDENLFEQEEFLRLVPTLKNTAFWNNTAALILAIFTLIFSILWLFIAFEIAFINDPVVYYALIGSLSLVIVTGWLAIRFFQTGRSLLNYVDSHQEIDLEKSLKKQAWSWRAFVVTLLLWLIVGVGGLGFMIFNLSVVEMDEPMMQIEEPQILPDIDTAVFNELNSPNDSTLSPK